MRDWMKALAVLLLASIPIQHAVAFQSDPSALWKNIKRVLIRPEGKEYFENSFKDAQIPTLVGTVVSSTPAVHPNELLVAIEDDHTPEVRLRLEKPLEKPTPSGTKVSFEGVPYQFTKEPFMVNFNVESVHFRTENQKKSEQAARKKSSQ
jgi:hypothetical protein